MPFVTVTYPPKFPLTESEKSWLEGRKVLCPRCDHYRAHIEGTGTCHRGENGKWMQAECRWFQRADLVPDYKDAAEFEAACAKRAEQGVFHDWHSGWGFEQLPCELCSDRGLDRPSPEDELKCLRCGPECKQMWSRILTEMEMEA